MERKPGNNTPKKSFEPTCSRCVHVIVCEHRMSLIQGFNRIIVPKVGGSNPWWHEAELLIAKVCQFKKFEEGKE